MSTTPPLAQPLFIFILGPPCAGKSTLCTALSTLHNLDHFSIGAETRSLISSYPTGHAARIKPLLSASALELFTRHVETGTLGPAHNTIKYVRERMFPSGGGGAPVAATRLLVDGFPRKLDRWVALKECAQGVWRPGTRTVAVVLDVERRVAWERFVARGREGDVFAERWDEYAEGIGGVIEGIRGDGVEVVRLCGGEGVGVEELVRRLGEVEAWRDVVG